MLRAGPTPFRRQWVTSTPGDDARMGIDPLRPLRLCGRSLLATAVTGYLLPIYPNHASALHPHPHPPPVNEGEGTRAARSENAVSQRAFSKQHEWEAEGNATMGGGMSTRYYVLRVRRPDSVLRGYEGFLPA